MTGTGKQRSESDVTEVGPAEQNDGSETSGAFIRTVLGDRFSGDFGVVYAHEHFIIDSLHVAAAFPHILLDSADAAVTELLECRAAGVGLALDAMPCASGRRIDQLALISERSGVDLIAATGLHHDRYYGPNHWTNHVGVDALAELFVRDVVDGVDLYDYTGPLVHRTPHRAGVIKVATAGSEPDARDLRNLEAVAAASVATGAPVLTHCEGGWGGFAQVDRLVGWGVPASSVLLSHVDKANDLGYLRELAQTGVTLELDQALRRADEGVDGFTVQAIAALVDDGFGDQLVVGTDGARRSLWRTLGGTPGLAWLAATLPGLLSQVGLDAAVVDAVMRANAVRTLSWRVAAAPVPEHDFTAARV